ncbi:sulfite exporter TauE/SafE family protein [Stenotrophomonas indicatrix]|uniref:sulfite exporter TauE/SafE family protein n=2 Tax=Stenotrophomonas indicatrix TaxID=2045451 RepID=UPI0028B1339B|nr:sulfite exporter TauE/SafE family protein [Stenotrophomonas indicatrix]
MELSSEFWWFILIGLGAQLVDGALGMAFGLVSSSVLLSMGLPPAQVSASVHTAEVFTTGASGVSHLVAGNVDKRLFFRLALPGALGGALGAYVLTQVPGDLIRPLIYLYLLVLAIIILARAAGRWMPKGEIRRVPVLGFFAGLLDASGGGGWGPVATSTLLARGGQARTTIGTVNAAEFVVTLTISATFLLSMGVQHLQIVAGLLIGGMMAAPVAAVLVKRVKELWVLVAVGVLVLGISLFQVGHALFGYLGRWPATS